MLHSPSGESLGLDAYSHTPPDRVGSLTIGSVSFHGLLSARSLTDDIRCELELGRHEAQSIQQSLSIGTAGHRPDGLVGLLPNGWQRKRELIGAWDHNAQNSRRKPL